MNTPNKLPTVRIDLESYFVDERLHELRHVDNPHRRISQFDFYADLSRGDLIHINGNEYETARFHLRAKRQYLVVRQPECTKDMAPPEDVWERIEARSDHEAAAIYAMQHVTGFGTFEIHVRPACAKRPCVIHTLTLVKTPLE